MRRQHLRQEIGRRSETLGLRSMCALDMVIRGIQARSLKAKVAEKIVLIINLEDH